MREETKNLLKNILSEHYSSNYVLVNQLIWNGFKGLNHLTDDELADEVKKMGFVSIEHFEENYAEDLGLVEAGR